MPFPQLTAGGAAVALVEPGGASMPRRWACCAGPQTVTQQAGADDHHDA